MSAPGHPQQCRTRGCPNLANPGAQAATFCFPQVDGLEKQPELNGKKDGVLQDKHEATGLDKADIQELEAKGEVSPEGQGAAGAAMEYLGAPLPPNETERHETLCACQILDTAPDPRFDDITKLVGLSAMLMTRASADPYFMFGSAQKQP